MLTLDTLREATGWVARLELLRKNAPAHAPEEYRLGVYRLEQALRDMGVDPGETAWPSPPVPTPPTAALRKAIAA